jgi:hypothetical protein
MSSLMGIIVMFACFGIYGWLSERALVRDQRRAHAVTGPHRTEDTNPSARLDS